jgi:cyclopropane fatty-acyl-phospholipid synthase-like methyltransferase
LEEAMLPNTPPPIILDVDGPWPTQRYNAVFTANTLHIMGWDSVQAFFRGVGQVLVPRGSLVVYGPFNYEGRYTSDSNREFDGWLKARDPQSAIRDFEAVDALAREQGLLLIDDVAMPANNRCLVWRKV